jgi:hypothetical protein
MIHADDPRPSLFGLARQLAGGVVRLARLEFAQGRQEIGEMLADTRVGAILIGIAVAILFLAVGTVDVVLVLGVVALLEVLPPVAGAIVVTAAFVAVLALHGATGVFGFIGRAWILVVVALAVVAAAFAVPIYLGFIAAWHAAMFVLVLQLSIAPMFVARGIRHIRIGPPEQTIESVKEDIAWAKRLLRRG